MKVNGQYSMNTTQWQQIQSLEAGQGTLSGLSSQQAAEVKLLESEGGPNGSNLSSAQLQELLALLLQNQAGGANGGTGAPVGSQSLGLKKVA